MSSLENLMNEFILKHKEEIFLEKKGVRFFNPKYVKFLEQKLSEGKRDE